MAMDKAPPFDALIDRYSSPAILPRARRASHPRPNETPGLSRRQGERHEGSAGRHRRRGLDGSAHATAFRTVPMVFGREPAVPVLEVVADVNEGAAKGLADEFGFARSTADWRDMLHDPNVDVVDITTPNDLHPVIAIAAAEAGKQHLLREAARQLGRRGEGDDRGGGEGGRRHSRRLQLPQEPRTGLRQGHHRQGRDRRGQPLPRHLRPGFHVRPRRPFLVATGTQDRRLRARSATWPPIPSATRNTSSATSRRSAA